MHFEKLCSTEILETVASANLRLEAAGTTIETKSGNDWKKDGADAAMSAL